MRFVSLGLDGGDAAVLRRAIAWRIANCGCKHGHDLGGRGREEGCGDCRVLAHLLDEFDRLLTRPAPRREIAAASSAAQRPRLVGAPDFDVIIRDASKHRAAR